MNRLFIKRTSNESNRVIDLGGRNKQYQVYGIKPIEVNGRTISEVGIKANSPHLATFNSINEANNHPRLLSLSNHLLFSNKDIVIIGDNLGNKLEFVVIH
ncbi:MAG: hypothetical protein mread185_000435 [Mycoplasmataceae bacterium]|nr:MAG: hypothetical protein mread185_000435 [Mycoplasmataceae bacterium]